MARRNDTRRTNCRATFSATSWASTSGFLTSWISRIISRLTFFSRSRFRFSISEPFLPMTSPGLAVWILILALLAARSISILATPAWKASFSEISGSRDLHKQNGHSPFPANHLESQVLLMPSLKPIGLTFCPNSHLPPSLSGGYPINRLLLPVQNHRQMAGPASDPGGATHGRGRNRLRIGPSSAKIRFTKSVSTSISEWASAFATAESISFFKMRAPF